MDPASPASPVVFQDAPQSIMPKHPEHVEETLQLQTPEQVRLLDHIDDLRSQGLSSHGISLPQLIVVGDQSSGKSSLLEGLTRLRFPSRGGKTCTTFATEVVLRNSPDVEIVCTITPARKKGSPEYRRLEQFKETFSSREQFNFPAVVEKAQSEMSLGLGYRVDDEEPPIFFDVLRIRYSAPNLPSLTVVDLPGLVEKAGGEVIEQLVKNYMQDKKSIILAVLQAVNDADNQKVLPRVKKVDPTGSRTLGILTKPDRAELGGEIEQALKILKNEKHPLKHGWHAVRNRGADTREHSDTQRDELEQQFFNKDPWNSIPRKNKGITALRGKLSKMLLEHISRELPSLVRTIQESTTETRRRLEALGKARETDTQQRFYLTRHAENFHNITHDTLYGTSGVPAFALKNKEGTTRTRLRTEIQNLNIAFNATMYSKGHTWEIVNDETSDAQANSSSRSPMSEDDQFYYTEPTRIKRSDFLATNIEEVVNRNRGMTLPALVDPCVIGEIFRQQSEPWRDIAEDHLRRVFQAVSRYIDAALCSSMDGKVRRMLMVKRIEPELENRRSKLQSKLAELLIPFTESEPLTYDPSFNAELEAIRAARCTEKLNSLYPNGLPNNILSLNTARHYQQQLFTETADNFTNSEILDFMQAYYKRAIAVFISNVTSLAIGNCLLKDLHAIFSPSLVASMEKLELEEIASESSDTRQERSELQQRLEVLEKGKQILHEHIALQPEPVAHQPPPRNPRNHARPQTIVSEPEIQHPVPELPSVPMGRDSLSLTPPSSVKSSRSPSRARADSVNASPSYSPPKRVERKRSPLPSFAKLVSYDAEPDEDL